MTKVRIFDLSKILDVSNKDLIDYLKDERGITVKSHSSSIDQTMANEIIAEFRRRKKAMKEGKPMPPRVIQPQPQVVESTRPVERPAPAAMDKPAERAGTAPVAQERSVQQAPRPAEPAQAAAVKPQEQVTAGPEVRSSAPVVNQPVPQEKPVQTPKSEAAERPAAEARPRETSERSQAPVRHEQTERPARTAPPYSQDRRQGDDRRPQNDRRPGEGRPPYQGRSEDGRPPRDDRRPGEGRPPYQGRQDGQRPPRDDRRDDRRPGEGRPQGEGRPPYQGRQDGQRPPREGGRPGEGRPQGEGRPPYQGRPDGQRPPREGGRPGEGRPPYQGRTEGGRPPYQGRTEGGRPPYQGRPDGQRPPREGGRPGEGRPPYQGRTEGGRPPYQGRPDGQRPPREGGRPGEGRPYQPRTGGGDRRGGFGGGFGNVPDKDADDRKPFEKKQTRGPRGPKDAPPPPEVKEQTRKEKDRGFKAENKYSTPDPDKAKARKKKTHKDFKVDISDEMEVIITPTTGQVPPVVEEKPEEEKVVKPVLATRTKTFSLTSRHRDRRRREAKVPEVTMKESTVKWMEIPESITVGDLAKKLEVQVNEIIKILMLKGIMASINQNLNFDLAASIVKKFGFRVEQKKEEEVKPEEEIDDPKLLSPRPPVVTVLGHVDHGKTSLLDCIRKTNVAAHEDGGITQSIGAYTVEIEDRKIVFLDTPGHEAFTEMRARGARVTDIAVLVVAADDGVMPQTVEAISHAKAAGVPVIVAINKIDKPEANPERVKQQMAEHDIVSEDWGGDVIMVPVSARSGMGIEDLLEMVLLVADVQEFKANPHRLAEGTIIESFMDTGHGPVATVVVQNGTLNVGDVVLVGNEWGRVKALLNDKGKRVKKAFPSTPVKIIGLSGVPEAGDHLQAIEDEKEAREISDSLKAATRDKKLQNLSRTSLDDLYRQMQAGEVKDLNIVLKADVQGSLEAVRHSLQRLSNVEVNINVLHGGVGAINKTDVMLAKASGAIIIGFNVRPDPITKRLAEQEQIDIRVYRVIYHIIDDVKAAMLGLLKPEFEEVQLGRAEVRAVFKVSKVGFISGCYVTEGKITRGSKARVIRDGVIVFEGKIDSLRRFKDDVKEVETNFECGIGVDKFGGMQPGDVIESYALQEVKRELADVEQLS